MVEWDLLNWQTMIIELVIAGGFAVTLSVFLFRKEQDRQELDRLNQRIRDLDHSIELKTLEIQAQKSEKILEEATKIIKEQAEFRKRREIWYQSEISSRIRRINSDVDAVEITYEKFGGSLEQKNSHLEYAQQIMGVESELIKKTIQENPNAFDPALKEDVYHYLREVESYRENIFVDTGTNRKDYESNVRYYADLLLKRLPVPIEANSSLFPFI